jgi:hypothetical protein
MTKYDCDICRGRGTIRLPIYRRLGAVVAEFSASPVIEDNARDYPCPECSDQVAFARVGIVGALKEMDTRIDDPKYIEHVKHAAAHSLIEEIINGGYVKLEMAPPDTTRMRQAYRVTLGVVSQKQVATIEERVARRQIDIAQEAATEAKAQIDNFGSYYARLDAIGKNSAARMIDEAVKTVIAKRAAWRQSEIKQ